MRSGCFKVLLLCWAAFAPAQDNPTVMVHNGPNTPPGSSVFWKRGQPAFKLIQQSAEARGGSIWVSSSADGLLIEGELDGDKPEWPATLPQMLGKDHIKVWLAGESKVAIRWGSRFGENDLKKVDDCAIAEAGRRT